MRRIVAVNISEWTADDIDRFAEHISSLSKTIETATLFTDIELLKEQLDKRFNEEPPRNCGHWKEICSALYPRENLIEIFVILKRVRLLPNLRGEVNFIKWVKE